MIFTIPAGKHSSRPKRFKLWFGKRNWTWKCKFDSSSQYTPDAEGDTNKLIGVGFLPGHHKCSVRIGWRWVGGKVELSSYTYVDGKRLIQHISYVMPGQEFTAEIGLYGKQFLVCIDGICVGTIAGRTPWFSYGLWPYFGGQATAPHEMKISITRI